MKIPFLPGAIGACLLLCSAGSNAGERLVSGQWQFTMMTEGESRTLDQCITPQKAAELNADSQAGRAYAEMNSKGRCTVDAYDATGNQVSYTLTCGDRVLRSVTTFAGDTSTGSLVTSVGGKAVTTSITARRTGDCR